MEVSTEHKSDAGQRLARIDQILRAGSCPVLRIEEYLLSSSGEKPGVVVENPTPEDSFVTLGSVLRLRYPGQEEEKTVVIVGAINDLPDELKQGMGLPKDVVLLKVDAPLVGKLLGKQVGHCEDSFKKPFTVTSVDNSYFSS